MEFKKSDIINLLLLLSVPAFGLGKYLAQTVNNSVGQIIAVAPLLIIVMFYLTDTLLKQDFEILLKPIYILVVIAKLSCIVSFYVGLKNGYPGFNTINTVTMIVVIVVIFNSPFIVQFYNRDNTSFSIANILYWGLTVDIFINILAYSLGLKNPVHSIEGRLNFPFGQGLYSFANNVAIINLLIIGRWSQGISSPGLKIFTSLQFILNLLLMVGFNSRLSILIFILILVLWSLKLLYHYRSIFVVSLFTIPLLLSFAEIIYYIISLPVFSTILKRVSYEDVTGFNGRRDLWERGIEWILNQGQGFIFGNGYHGYYYIGLLDDLEEYWAKSAINLHLHSSSLEYALSTGMVGLLSILILLFIGLSHITKQAMLKHNEGMLIGVLFYLLFIFQIDNFVYVTNYGVIIFFVAISGALLKRKNSTIILQHQNANA